MSEERLIPVTVYLTESEAKRVEGVAKAIGATWAGSNPANSDTDRSPDGTPRLSLATACDTPTDADVEAAVRVMERLASGGVTVSYRNHIGSWSHNKYTISTARDALLTALAAVKGGG